MLRRGQSRRARQNKRSGDCTQLSLDAIHFFFRVVVDEADAKEPPVLLYAQALGEVEGVVVAVPGEDAALAKLLRQLGGMMALHANCERRAALMDACGIGDSVEAEPGDFS